MPLADVSFGDLLLTVFEISLVVIWIWILFTIITDLFRDHELSGWWKAVWILFLVFVPFLAALVYLVARGNGMRERTIRAQTEAKKHFDDYVRAVAGSPADEIAKAKELLDSGAIDADEFAGLKAKALA